jgi:transposase
MYDAIQERIAAYEQEILRKLAELESAKHQGESAPLPKNANKAKLMKNRGQEALRQALYRMSGVDATQIDAIGVETMEVVISEYGPDLSRFPTEKHFVSHATLAPHVRKSGNKPVKKKKRNSASARVAAALRMAALSRRHSPKKSSVKLLCFWRNERFLMRVGQISIESARRANQSGCRYRTLKEPASGAG